MAKGPRCSAFVILLATLIFCTVIETMHDTLSSPSFLIKADFSVDRLDIKSSCFVMLPNGFTLGDELSWCSLILVAVLDFLMTKGES